METNETTAEQYLSFGIGEELFAVDVAKVREVLEIMPITKIPRAPDFMKGVINVRGSVVPVVDLRIKFGMAEAEDTVDTCIVVMEVNLETETIVLGAKVDAVEEVVDLDSDQIEPAPKIGTRLNTEFIKGIGKREDKFIILLDIDRMFSSEELALVREAEGILPTTAPEPAEV